MAIVVYATHQLVRRHLCACLNKYIAHGREAQMSSHSIIWTVPTIGRLINSSIKALDFPGYDMVCYFKSWVSMPSPLREVAVFVIRISNIISKSLLCSWFAGLDDKSAAHASIVRGWCMNKLHDVLKTVYYLGMSWRALAAAVVFRKCRLI